VIRSESYEKTEQAAKAIVKVMDWLDVSRYAMTDAVDATTDQVDAEIRDAMEQTKVAINKVLFDLAGPIWTMLPESVAEECRKARLQ
jgi:hypothetical protein